MLVKDILAIDLSEDIKNVIDLEDISEAAIKSEIENYIITDGLANEYADFASVFTSNIVESGVWISGFYGSGKSYFGKLLGYLLSNPTIAGTPARDRILQRFTGITNEALIKNSILKLNSEKCRVVFLDVAKQDTSKGLAYTLFRNFLKSLGLPENEHGFFLYQLMINENTADINGFIDQNLNKNWADIRSKLIEYAKAAKQLYLKQGNTEGDYEHLLTTIRREIDQFSASRLKDEITNYLQIKKDEKIIFLFDEASEAINQNKFNLLDLEGISEALSALGGRVWTIAIAQEKLNDVISNSSISKAQLTKVTDRFKTKIHLEATEVEVIIRNRLLKKKDSAIQKLTDHYQKNSGKINDHAALQGNGIVKTDSLDSYLTYYPFYKHQFNLLQNFLFGTKGLASTKVAARGMIITTYDILRQELQKSKLFEIAAGWQIAKEAQQQPPVRLVNRFDNAERIIKEKGLSISGRKLLETINFLTEAEVVPTTLSNIVKSYINDPDEFFKVQPEIVKALDALIEAKVLLSSDGTYRITSDIEQRLLDEMNGFIIQGYMKKKRLVAAYKSSTIIKDLSKINESNVQYDFYIMTDNDDELTNPQLKQLKIKVKSVYNLSDNRSTDVDALRTQFQNDKETIWIVPENDSFREIDKLISDLERIASLEEKYKNPQSEEVSVIRNFSKREKEDRLKLLVEQSFQQAASIYLYNINQLNSTSYQSIMQSLQRQLVQNVYNKRLSAQLGDDVASRVIKEANDTRLHSYFNGPEFKFFDAQGNFIGNNLKVVEEINFKIRNTFVDGSTLEKDLEQPPTGFAFGTVISTMAALMRAGKVIAKYNGADKFSWRDDGVTSIFSAAREFRKASFKAVSRSLTAVQKNEIVTSLQSLNCEDHINRKIDWNTNDFDLVNAVKELAKYSCDKVIFLKTQNKDFNNLFSSIETQKDYLSGFIGAVSEANYIEKAENYLAQKEKYTGAVEAIEKAERFVSNNLSKVRKWKIFADNVKDELNKAARPNILIQELEEEFDKLYHGEVVKNFGPLQQIIQKIKDEYFILMTNVASEMAQLYEKLKVRCEALINEISSLPAGLNAAALITVQVLLKYSSQRTLSNMDIDWDVKDKNTKYTYSEILSFIELFSKKSTELDVIKASLLREIPLPGASGSDGSEPAIQLFVSRIPAGKIKVSDYKSWLQGELQKIAGANDNDEVEFDSDKELNI